MRVLQINANFGFSSTGLIVKDIADQIKKDGLEPFCAYQKTNAPVNNGYQIGNKFDWKLHAFFSRILGRQGYYSYFATKKFLKYIDKIKPDVIHLHNLHSNYININLLLKFIAKKDIPTIITFHDCWFFTGKCFHYVDFSCDRYKTGCGKCPKKKAPPKSLIFDFSSQVLKNKIKRLTAIPRLKIIGCSDWICNEAKNSLLKDCDISRIYNGVDINVFCPKNTENLRNELGASDNFLVLGMANKWFLDQNISLIEKVKTLPNTKLILVGCNENQLRFLKENHSEVIGVGFVKDREELARYYSVADVFVNLTFADTLPTVNMESICCGTPVITYDGCGSPELVDKDCGVIVKKGDTDGIINALNNIRETDFSDCYKIGQEKFDKNKCYKEYIKEYSRLCTR